MSKYLVLLLIGWVLGGISLPLRAQSGKYQFDLRELHWRDPAHSSLQETGAKPILQVQTDTLPSFLTLPGATDGYAWEKARYLVMEVEHNEAHAVILWFDFYPVEHPDRPRVRFKTGVLPGLRTQVIFPLSYLSGQSIYIPRYPRQLKGSVEGTGMSGGTIAKMGLRLAPIQPPWFSPKLRIYDITLRDELPEPLPPLDKPLVDSLGQWAARDWPGKTRDLPQLQDRVSRQMRQARQWKQTGSPFLGQGKRPFPATGFFRTEWDGKRWWLVDPLGYPFLSNGIDCIRPSITGPVFGNEDLLSVVPIRNPRFQGLFSWHGTQTQFNFLGYNLQRSLGDNWKSDWARFARWFVLDQGFNTVGNWSDPAFCRSARLPWVFPMANFPKTRLKVFRDFPDAFDPAFEDSCRQFARQLEPLRNDSFLIGYFLRNEPEWAFGAHNLAAEMLGLPDTSFTRKALVTWLSARYKGNILALNARWGSKFSHFAQLDTGNWYPLPRPALADLDEFSGIMVDTMLARVCREVKKTDPHHLNLGMRYAWISSELCYRAGKHFDVFSLNGYGDLPPTSTAEVAKRLKKPVLIGEFHMGALDRGLPASGIAANLSSKERGWAIRRYLEQAFARPEVVGVHYFQLYDQPFTGRFDGENYQIGLLDVANQPYEEVLQSVKKANQYIYRVARKRRSSWNPGLKPVLPIYY